MGAWRMMAELVTWSDASEPYVSLQRNPGYPSELKEVIRRWGRAATSAPAPSSEARRGPCRASFPIAGFDSKLALMNEASELTDENSTLQNT